MKDATIKLLETTGYGSNQLPIPLNFVLNKAIQNIILSVPDFRGNQKHTKQENVCYSKNIPLKCVFHCAAITIQKKYAKFPTLHLLQMNGLISIVLLERRFSCVFQISLLLNRNFLFYLRVTIYKRNYYYLMIFNA